LDAAIDPGNPQSSVTFVEGQHSETYLCVAMRKKLTERIRLRSPHIQIFNSTASSPRFSKEMIASKWHPAVVDFLRLATSPVLVRTPSSYSLWAAFINNGTVYSPPNELRRESGKGWQWQTAYFGQDWIWVKTAKGLLNDNSMERAGFRRRRRAEADPTWIKDFLTKALVVA
jgi:hypothetical protein